MGGALLLASDNFDRLGETGSFLVGIVAAVGIVGGAVRWAVKRLEGFIDDRLTDKDGVPLATVLDRHLDAAAIASQAAEERFSRIENKQQAHEEAIAMWRAIEKIADSTPPAAT